jgi:hypothetical protein
MPFYVLLDVLVLVNAVKNCAPKVKSDLPEAFQGNKISERRYIAFVDLPSWWQS